MATAIKKHLRRLRQLSRRHARQQKGSANRRTSAWKLAKLHAQIARVRQNWTHQTTTDLTRRFAVIGIENLHVRGMIANEQLARSIHDIGFYEFPRQLDYRAALSGGTVVVVNRWFPSSKTCSSCRVKAETMPLSVRQWTCAHCGAEHDRDINAAQNIEREALATARWAGRYAGGEQGAGRGLRRAQSSRRKTPVKPASVKQEMSRVLKCHG